MKFVPRAALIGSLIIGSSAAAFDTNQIPIFFRALDGDTVAINGEAIRVRGIDAPELGPWARCWAEAALAGHARFELERKLSDRKRGWRTKDLAVDANGKRSAWIVDRKGYDVGEEMAVSGHAARTDGRWDWCGQEADLHDVLQDEKVPHGPSLWWSTGDVFDPRAAD